MADLAAMEPTKVEPGEWARSQSSFARVSHGMPVTSARAAAAAADAASPIRSAPLLGRVERRTCRIRYSYPDPAESI